MKKSIFLKVFLILFCSRSFSSAQSQYIQLNPVPTRVIGQIGLTQSSPNLVEGRELNGPLGVALDLNLTPPALYVADTGNNRVLGFRNASAFNNGQKADIVIGQIDFQSTSPQGPQINGGPGRGGRTSGLAAPTGLAVDGQSNLYVVDAANNRVVRFPKPFSQTDQLSDFVIGQPGSTSLDANHGGISATSLNFSNLQGVLQAYLTFDVSGNLWIADAGNNRVLRFPAALLGVNAKSGPAADLVLGQLDFATTTPNVDPTNLTFLNTPTGIVFDGQGRLFVSESQSTVRSRILIYAPPLARNGQNATRLLGIVPTTVVPQPPAVSEQQFGGGTGSLFLINNGVGIVDTQNSRLLAFKPVDQFTTNNLTQQAQIQYLFGQTDFSSNRVNESMPEPGPDRLALPGAAALSATEIFIADTGNNRVIVVPYTANSVGTASRVLGQDQFNLNGANLVEGREFRFTAPPSQAGAESGIVADLTSNPPHLYVSDTFNNRVLGFRDLRNLKPGDKADIVIGQPDFAHTEINYPLNDPNNPNAASLYQPAGLALDPAGNLYVADSGNGRVLRFTSPFTNPSPLPAANLVLGQRSFTSRQLDASVATMAYPYGLAFASNNGLLVSDAVHHRILYFAGAPGTLTNGQAAANVFGQPNFTSAAATPNSTVDNRFNAPRGISTDNDDRLYVADSGNNRIVIFERAPSQQIDPRPSRVLSNLSGARGVYVNPKTLEVWVAAAGANAVVRFPKFIDQPLTGFTPNASIPDGGPLAVTQDAFGNLYTTDVSNRVQINFPGLATVNAATLVLNQAQAPGSIATIFSLFDGQFGTATATSSGSPLPMQLAGVQVSLNNIAVPLYFVGPNQINFVIPQGAPTNGTGDLLVSRVDSGQVLGNFPIQLTAYQPAIFARSPTTPGAGQAAVLNQDGTVNDKDHPATNGSIISIFGTGEGVVPGAPPDGVAPTTAISTPVRPMVAIGTAFVDDKNITYSGLAPGLVGVWQINVLIPDTVAATSLTNNITPLFVQLNGVASSAPGRVTTIWVTGKK